VTYSDESLITPELEQIVGRDGPVREATVTDEVVRRVLETMQDDDPRWTGDATPPYVLMAFGADLPLPETPRSPLGLVSGDEWTLHRPIRVGERLTSVGRLVSVHERFGSRFGHNLVLRTTWTFTDAAGALVAEVGRSMIRYAPPDDERPGTGDRGPEGSPLAAVPPNAEDTVAPHSAAGTQHAPLSEGELLPPVVVRPSLAQVVRYCGLTWNFVPFFFDPEEARRGGLPGTIVPGPLKLAMLTRYLTAWAGPGGAVHAVRCAHRRPDPTGQPFTIRGLVTRVVEEHGVRLIDCEVWTENQAGERSVAGSATIVAPPA
jgi:acyl dehydratase